MNIAKFLIPITLAAATVAATAEPFTTDEVRAEVSQRNEAAARAAALMPEVVGSTAVRVTDTDSARSAAAERNSRMARESHRAEVLRAGSGAQPGRIQVTDTDSARDAASQVVREQALKGEYTEYLQAQAQRPLSGAVQ